MICLELNISNEAARASRAEVRRFLILLGERMAGEKKDKNDTATLAHVVFSEMKLKLDAHIKQLDEDAQSTVRRDLRPVREQRRFR